MDNTNQPPPYDDPEAPCHAGAIRSKIREFGRGDIDPRWLSWVAGYERRAALVAKSDAMRSSRFRSPEQIRQELAAAVPANYAIVTAKLLKGEALTVPGGKAVAVEIGREDAELLLKLNVRNRELNARRCDKIVADLLERGDGAAAGWDFITLLKSGELIDGQHRLHAVVEAAKAGGADIRVLVMIRFDAEESITSSIDAGRQRDERDRQDMRIRGLKNRRRGKG